MLGNEIGSVEADAALESPADTDAVPSSTNDKQPGWQGWGHWLQSDNSANTALATPVPTAVQPGSTPSSQPAAMLEVQTTGRQHEHDCKRRRVDAEKAAESFLPFSGALVVARSLGLNGKEAWKAWCKEGMRPPNVPSRPDDIYEGGGWQGWGHWLGTGNAKGGHQAAHFLPFKKALTVARSLGLSSRVAWRAWCKNGMRPPNVPADPCKAYKDGGWEGWAHWLANDSGPCTDPAAACNGAECPSTSAEPNGHGEARKRKRTDEGEAPQKNGSSPPSKLGEAVLFATLRATCTVCTAHLHPPPRALRHTRAVV